MIRTFFALFFIISSVAYGANDQNSIPALINIHSSRFLGKPYQLGALGEGPARGSIRFNRTKDQDPLLRYDAFDCTTFVETVMALTFTSLEGRNIDDARDVTRTLNRIRYYRSQIGFLTRNHMTSTDWIPFNIHEGLVKDITQNTFGQFKNAVQISNTEINRGGWLRAQGFEKIDSKQMSKMPYVTLKFLLNNPRLIKRMPHGAIMNIARPGWDLRRNVNTFLDVSHQGYVIHRNGKVYFRNANLTKMKVIDSEMISYLREALKSPTIKGVNLLLVTHP